MRKRFPIIGLLIAIACCWTACKDDVSNTGQSVLDKGDAIIVLADTFSFESDLQDFEFITSQPDSFLLGEIETDYGLLRASILTQLACPEGYHYPENFHVDSIDSICLFLHYSSWVGDANSPLAINAYMLDKNTFQYAGTYRSNLNIDDYCSRDHCILANRHIIIASEKLDSIANSSGVYEPMIRMRVNDDFIQYFGSITSFDSQEKFNQIFKGLLIETSFGSSTVLNITDIALGVYYRFSYKKGDRDTIVHDMKGFYANSEVRTVNHIHYPDKLAWTNKLKLEADSFNYIVAPAGVYTRLRFPMEDIEASIMNHMETDLGDGTTLVKRPYVNKAEVRVDVENVFTGSESEYGRKYWLQPAANMLLIRKNSIKRFFENKELPSDTCALLASLTQGTDSLGSTVYYYSYDLSDFLTNQLRQEANDTTLEMILMPVTVETSTTSSATVVSSVQQQQTISATKIRSAKNGMKLEIVYSGF